MEQLGIKQFQAKIGLSNLTSIQMFKSMGFEETSRSEVFGEVTLAVAFDHVMFVRCLKERILNYTLLHHCYVPC